MFAGVLRPAHVFAEATALYAQANRGYAAREASVIPHDHHTLTDRRQVAEQLTRVSELASLNSRLIEELRKRLSCVMPPQPPDAGAIAGGNPRASMSPMAEEIDSLAGIINRNNESLQYLMGVIEI